MKKIFALTVAFIAGIAMTASAASLAPGQMTKCNDAKSITFENAGPANDASGKDGYTTNDRGGANVMVWFGNYIIFSLTKLIRFFVFQLLVIFYVRIFC